MLDLSNLVAWVGIEPTDVNLMRVPSRLCSILAIKHCTTKWCDRKDSNLQRPQRDSGLQPDSVHRLTSYRVKMEESSRIERPSRRSFGFQNRLYHHQQYSPRHAGFNYTSFDEVATAPSFFLGRLPISFDPSILG